MAKAYAGSEGVEGRRDFVARILRDRPTCQAGRRIGCLLAGLEFEDRPDRATDPVYDRCTRCPTDVHEILARSAGGSILDDANVLALCRACHTWVGDHPKEALSIGLRRSRYEGRNLPVNTERTLREIDLTLSEAVFKHHPGADAEELADALGFDLPFLEDL